MRAETSSKRFRVHRPKGDGLPVGLGLRTIEGRWGAAPRVEQAQYVALRLVAQDMRNNTDEFLALSSEFASIQHPRVRV